MNKKIYIIVREYGEYSDFGYENMYAFSNETKAEAYLKQLEESVELFTKARDDIYEFEKLYFDRNPQSNADWNIRNEWLKIYLTIKADFINNLNYLSDKQKQDLIDEKDIRGSLHIETLEIMDLKEDDESL